MSDRKITYSVDVEEDLHTGEHKGITQGLKEFEKVCDNNKVKPVLFVIAECIKKNPEVFKRLNKKGWEISLHGFSHKRFDEMSFDEKEEEITKSLTIFKKHLGIKPKGFRAPQHSIDSETLDLLEKYGFEYDSSYTPLNLLQLLFFPRKFKLWSKNFFSPLNAYRIRERLEERPTSALILPFVSLIVRVFPVWITKVYLALLKLFYRKPMFYAHSWDFIELKESRTDKMFPHTRFITKLEKLMES